jgi:Family of unknown function (DUF6510)
MMEPTGGGAGHDRALELGALEEWVLDGNAIGGLLTEVFGTEMTTATGTCGHCGRVSQVAELAVYQPGLGTVVRCRSCSGVLMVFVQVRGITCVDLEGLASLTSGEPRG